MQDYASAVKSNKSQKMRLLSVEEVCSRDLRINDTQRMIEEIRNGFESWQNIWLWKKWQEFQTQINITVKEMAWLSRVELKSSD